MRRRKTANLDPTKTMPVTTLDPKTALIVIDLQKGILAYGAALPLGDVIGNAAALAEAFRQRDLPVVLVNVDGGAPGRAEQTFNRGPRPDGWTDLLPELNHQPQDIVVTKKTWGAFASTDLDARLKALGVTQVVVCGVATSFGVESTARQAYEQGYHVTVATDATADMILEAHMNSLTRIFPRLGETGTTQEIIDRLDGVFPAKAKDR
ncbi:MAG TPA: isochorismatase family protein [Chthoniobacter sp.]